MISAVLLLGSLVLLLAWLRAIQGKVRVSPHGRKAGTQLPDEYHNNPQGNPYEGR